MGFVQGLMLMLLAAGGIVLLIAFLIAPARDGDMSAFEGRDFAHRGLHDNPGGIPENSLAAFEEACRAGYGIEMDVRYSKDGVIMVFHDDDLMRACGVQAEVREKTAEELGRTRLFGTEHVIPTFDEALEAIGGRVPLIVEIKSGPDVRKLTREVIARLRDYPGAYCLESFNPLAMGEARRVAPHVLRGQLVAGYRDLKAGAGPAAILLCNLMLNVISRPHFIARDEAASRNVLCMWAERMGAATALWTLRTPGQYASAGEKDMRIFEKGALEGESAAG